MSIKLTVDVNGLFAAWHVSQKLDQLERRLALAGNLARLVLAAATNGTTALRDKTRDDANTIMLGAFETSPGFVF